MSNHKNQTKDELTVDMDNAFITVWRVNAGNKIAFDVNIKVIPDTAKQIATIDWGDGCIEHKAHTWGNQEFKHVYAAAGDYTVSITGINRFWVDNKTGNAKKLIDIKQWGNAKWCHMKNMFNGARNMRCSATDTPNLSKVISMGHMFCNCMRFNSPIDHWDISAAANMNGMLKSARAFNQPINKLLQNLSGSININNILEDTRSFHQDLEKLQGLKTITKDMFGENKSLKNYISEYKERLEIEKEKEKIHTVLKYRRSLPLSFGSS